MTTEAMTSRPRAAQQVFRRLLEMGSLAMIFALQGCTPVPTVMRYEPSKDARAERLLWPAPPETPRFLYSGQLVGESNFGPEDDATQPVGQRIVRWLVGLGDEDRTAQRRLVRPQSGVVDGDGRIYVTDAGRSSVFVFDEMQGKLLIWGNIDEFTTFVSPVGIAVTATGEVLVADAGLGRVIRLNGNGDGRGSFGQGVLNRPTGLARDPETGTIFVADTAEHNIKVFDNNGKLLRTLGGPGRGPGQFNSPTHLAFNEGALYVSDTLNARVQIIDALGMPIGMIGERGLYVGNLTRPKGIAVDSDNHIYVIESYYDHLIVFDRAGRYLLPIGGTGSEVGRFFLPSGVWIDDRQRVFIADMFNGRVIVLQYLGS